MSYSEEVIEKPIRDDIDDFSTFHLGEGDSFNIKRVPMCLTMISFLTENGTEDLGVGQENHKNTNERKRPMRKRSGRIKLHECHGVVKNKHFGAKLLFIPRHAF